MMTKEDYVSLEIAKLLKEKGYKEKSLSSIRIDESIIHYDTEQCDGDMISIGDTQYEYLCPTLYEAAKWLRKEKKLNIQIEYDHSQLWGYVIVWCDGRSNEFINGDSMFDTYEKAFNAGILETLNFI